MADPLNPINQPQRDLFSTPLPAAAASGPLPSNTLGSASKKSEVLLCDWWLVAAAEAEAREGRRLCVGGVVAGRCPRRDERSGSKSLLSPWQKAERVFESAPITKRHDAFTLGTADGITVRIQGVVNQAHSHQNGFPLEVSDRFLVGFPYNWDSYAGACFEETYNGTSAPASAASANDISKGLFDTKDCLFTVHLDDFSLCRIHGASIDGIDGSVTRKFRDFLERFCTTPIVKSCLPQETPNKFEGEIADGLVAEGLEHMSHFEEVSVSSPSGQRETLVEGLGLTPVLKEPMSEKENYEKEINIKKHENGTIHGLAAGLSNATGCHRDGLQADGVGGENSSAITANIQHNISLNSSLHLTSEVDRLYVKATVVQKVPSLENIPEPDNCTHFAGFVTVNLDNVNHMPNCIAEAECESSSSLADSVRDTIPSDMLPEELNMSYPNHNRKLGNVRRSDGSELDFTAHMDILDMRSNITSEMGLKEPLTLRMQLDVTGTENIEETAITDVKSCIPQEAPSKQEREKSSKKHGSSTNHVAEGPAGGPSKAVGSHMIELHANGVVAENSIVLRSNNEHDISFSSSLQLTSQTYGVPLEGSFIQRATQLENIAETEKGIHLVRSFPVCVDTKSPMPNCIGDANTESTTCLTDLGIESVLKDKLPKKLFSHPKHCMKFRNVRRSDGSEGTGAQIIGVSKGSLGRNIYDMKEANLSSPIEVSRKPVDSVSSKVSDEKEKVRRSSRVASKLNRGILETNRNSEFHTVKDPTGSIEYVNMSITSEGGLMKSLAEPVGRRKRLMKLSNFEKDQFAESMDMKSCMHNTPSEQHESAGNEINWSEMDQIGKNLHGAVDEMLLKENDTAHMELGNASQSVVRKLFYTTHSGCLVDSSTISESQCLEKRRNKAMKFVEQTPATDATLASRMTKLKNQGDNERINSLEAESNEGSSVRVDHCFVKTASDGNPKRRQISACDLATAGAVKFSLESSTKELHIDPVPTIDRLADQQTSVNTGHESEFFKFPAANTSHSDILVEMHPSKGKKSDVIICETSDKLSTQHKTKKKYLRKKTKSSCFSKKNKQSSLSVNQDCKKTSLLHSSRTTIWRPSYDIQCPLTRDRATKLCIASPESLDLKRSRAGRLLVPQIEKWCQKIVYAKDGEIVAITGDNLDNFPVIGIQSEPPRKRRRHV